MNKTELVAAMAEQTNLSKKDAEAALKAFIDVVSEELKKGEKVQLVGFGTSDRSFQSPEIQSRKSFKGHDELSKNLCA